MSGTVFFLLEFVNDAELLFRWFRHNTLRFPHRLSTGLFKHPVCPVQNMSIDYPELCCGRAISWNFESAHHRSRTQHSLGKTISGLFLWRMLCQDAGQLRNSHARDQATTKKA